MLSRQSDWFNGQSRPTNNQCTKEAFLQRVAFHFDLVTVFWVKLLKVSSFSVISAIARAGVVVGVYTRV